MTQPSDSQFTPVAQAPRSLMLRPAILLFLVAVISPARGQILADFEISLQDKEFGRFTIQLDQYNSPHATANFIRLAEGLVPWVDSRGGQVRQAPFYDGLSFHSLTAGTEIASGSRDGTGRDNAGWTLRDDFTLPGSGTYTVYMENDGPNSNGSRFFINIPSALSSNPARAGKAYTAFARVLQPTFPPGGNGRLTVAALSNSLPGFHIIDSVRIRYLTPGDLTFRRNLLDPEHFSLFLLPSARSPLFSFRRSGPASFLDWNSTPGSTLLLWSSLDLRNWLGPFSLNHLPGSEFEGYDLSSTQAFASRAFFRGGVVEYPHWPSTERNFGNAAVLLNFRDPNRGIVNASCFFDETGYAGTYQSTFGTGDFVVSREEVTPYTREFQLSATTGNQPTYRFILHYDLAWSNGSPPFSIPVLANPSRLEGSDLLNAADPIENGSWRYVRTP